VQISNVRVLTAAKNASRHASSAGLHIRRFPAATAQGLKLSIRRFDMSLFARNFMQAYGVKMDIPLSDADISMSAMRLEWDVEVVTTQVRGEIGFLWFNGPAVPGCRIDLQDVNASLTGLIPSRSTFTLVTVEMESSSGLYMSAENVNATFAVSNDRGTNGSQPSVYMFYLRSMLENDEPALSSGVTLVVANSVCDLRPAPLSLSLRSSLLSGVSVLDHRGMFSNLSINVTGCRFTMGHDRYQSVVNFRHRLHGLTVTFLNTSVDMVSECSTDRDFQDECANQIIAFGGFKVTNAKLTVVGLNFSSASWPGKGNPLVQNVFGRCWGRCMACQFQLRACRLNHHDPQCTKAGLGWARLLWVSACRIRR
jgi:hypothetical protein